MVLYKRDLENGRELEFSYRDVDHDNLMIFLPGISGSAISERFKYLEEIAVHSGYSMVRMDFQFQEFKDESLAIKDCITDILAVVEYLRRRDINTAKDIIFIAKSFGALVYQLMDEESMNITKAILLAPYIKITDDSADAGTDFADIPIKDLKINEICLSRESLRNIPTLIFHGLKDTVIDMSSSENITQLKEDYILERVNTGHGFDEAETHTIVVKKSLKFLKDGVL